MFKAQAFTALPKPLMRWGSGSSIGVIGCCKGASFIGESTLLVVVVAVVVAVVVVVVLLVVVVLVVLVVVLVVVQNINGVEHQASS